ncbi:MAG: PEP-CTERM-box response regulator transcription factor [Alcanivoracaceae bacterium]|jgi:two-component system, NtrC family, response regulator|nr:PEP-CTERM-box response regulator transcription factor [Alcanivoracaceae bacterium]
MEKRLLIIEDDPGLQKQMKWCFDDTTIAVADRRDPALAELRRLDPQVVTLDLGLPPDAGGASEGFALLKTILELRPQTKVIVITGREEREHAARAIGMGACDFYQKPLDPDTLTFVVNRAFRLVELEEENRRLGEKAKSPLAGIIATSPEMLETCRHVEKIAAADITTLILGETGTGKELIARAIHALSDRSQKPFVAINCAAIPETLLESELFGHERGAFTGANQLKRGKIEVASGGTLFLDEIGDMPAPLQAKMLRFLQERVIERLGGHTPIAVDVRVVAATHRNLDEMIRQGEFREDLYYRLAEMSIHLPPLRERSGDAVALARVFVTRYAEQLKRPVKGLGVDAVALIARYGWPGNVREMENRLKRAVLMADGHYVTARDLNINDDGGSQQSVALNLRDVREQAESRAIRHALQLSSNNIAAAARQLGVTRPTLYSLLEKYHIRVE